MLFSHLVVDRTVTLPLTAFLALDDVFALAPGSCDCCRLCRDRVCVVNLQALDGDPSAALWRLTHSSLTDHGASVREINAAFCNSIGNSAIQSLPALPALRILNLDGCQKIDDDGLIELASRCQGLRVLSLYWNVKVTDHGLCRLFRAQQGSDLRDVNLSGCKYLTDKTIQRLVERAPLLDVLDLTRCPAVSDAGMTLVCECLDRLRVLRLYAMSQLSPTAFAGLHKLVCLEELDLCGCCVEDDAIVRLMDAQPSRLQILNLTWCVAITDAVVQAMARSCPRLGWLSLFGNKHITDAAIEGLAAAPCGHVIHSLDVRGLTQASNYAFDPKSLQQLFPCLKNTDLHH